VKVSQVVGSVFFFCVSFGLTIAVLAATQVVNPLPADPSPSVSRLRAVAPERYTDLSEAFRRGQIGAVEELLDAEGAAADVETQVLLALYEHSAGQHREAVERLLAADRYGGELEDWRLWALGASAAATAQPDHATRAFGALIETFPGSPLVGRATVGLAEQAANANDWRAVLAAANRSADFDLDNASRERLALLSWTAAQGLADDVLLTEVARRLLVHHPLKAAELGVVEQLRLPDGSVAWTSVLSTSEVVTRAESLIAVGLPESAVELLDKVAAETRDLEWTLTQAAALTEAKRGEEALALLAAFPASEAGDVRLEWAQARAAIEASTPRRERRHLSTEDRTALRERARRHLRRTAEQNAAPELASAALRLLFAELLEEDRFEEALAAVVRLREIDPSDFTGARSLWHQGWSHYTQRNYSGAVGYWTELARLYPRSNYNRAGLYWSGRAHEHLGNKDRAQALFHEVADADFTDIYRRYALERLGTSPPEEPAQQQPTEPWPTDARLARAERLHQLALEDLALLELDTVAAADSRSRAALRARVLAAKGERRQSIIALRSAFPLLGTPHQNLVPLDARQLYYPLDFSSLIEKHSSIQQISHHLVFGMIRQESAFDAGATSWAGARGLMQIMPATARELAGRMGLEYSRERLDDPEYSVQLGTRYFKQMLDIFDGNEVLALAGYNAGPYRIKRLWREAGSDPELDHFVEQLSLEETKSYVKRVLLYSDSYRRLYDSAG
jgi:soluble lytic murein transglycosylase-like protein